MSQSNSVSHWIANLKKGEFSAAQHIWDRFSDRLLELARRQMKNMPKRIADEEDVAASVFHCLCRGAAAGRLQNVKNRDELWWQLLAITKNKVIDHVRHEKAQKRQQVRKGPILRHDSGGHGNYTLESLVSDEPSPEFVVMLQEQNQRLLGLLRDDDLRRIAVSRMEGLTVSEIAGELKLSTRSVERKLQLIRGVWSKELEEA